MLACLLIAGLVSSLVSSWAEFWVRTVTETPQKITKKFVKFQNEWKKPKTSSKLFAIKITNWRQPMKLKTPLSKFLNKKILIRENQLKKRLFTPFTVSHQRNPKFFDPEQSGGARDELEIFKFNMKTKFQSNDDWYFTEKKSNYAFSLFKNFVHNQFFLINFNNVLKINTVEFFYNI